MHTSTNQTSFLSTRRGRLTLALVCLAGFLDFIDTTIVNVALPTLVRDLHATSSQLQWILDAYALVFGGLLLVAGSLADRVGRKRTFLAGLVAFATEPTAVSTGLPRCRRFESSPIAE